MSTYTIFARKRPENFDLSSADSYHYVTNNRIGDINSNYMSYNLAGMPGCCGFLVLNSIIYESDRSKGNDTRDALWSEFSNLLYNALHKGGGDINYANYSYLFYVNRNPMGYEGFRFDLLRNYTRMSDFGPRRNYILTDAYYPGESDFKNPALNRVFRFYRDTMNRKEGIWDVHHTGYYNRNSEKQVTALFLSFVDTITNTEEYFVA